MSVYPAAVKKSTYTPAFLLDDGLNGGREEGRVVLPIVEFIGVQGFLNGTEEWEGVPGGISAEDRWMVIMLDERPARICPSVRRRNESSRRRGCQALGIPGLTYILPRVTRRSRAALYF